MNITEFSIGEEFYEAVKESVIADTQGWAIERVQRISKRLQAKEPVATHLVPKVIWGFFPNAFTLPGRYVYFARELLQWLTEEATAFVFAHELAHHKLGHLSIKNFRLPMLRVLPGAMAFRVLASVGSRMLFSPENEMEADRLGFELCRNAGYDPLKCLEFFRLIEKRLLDLGQCPDTIFTPELDKDREKQNTIMQEEDSTIWERVSQRKSKAKKWLRERGYGYKTFHERYDALRATL